MPVDAVLLPVAPHAAVIPGQFYYYSKPIKLTPRNLDLITSYEAYSSIVNVLDYVSIVIPVTTADKDIDIFDNQYKPLNSVDKKNWRACKFSIKTSLKINSKNGLTEANSLQMIQRSITEPLLLFSF